jgi:hypothetical protein
MVMFLPESQGRNERTSTVSQLLGTLQEILEECVLTHGRGGRAEVDGIAIWVTNYREMEDHYTPESNNPAAKRQRTSDPQAMVRHL